MERRRREFLGAVGATGIGFVAGCIGGGGGSSSPPDEQSTALAPENPEDWYRQYEMAVSESGQTVLVGAWSDLDAASGAVHVFDQSRGTWEETVKLTPSEREDGTRFGTSVDVASDGDIAAIGTYASGKTYIFQHNSGSWSEESIIEGRSSNGLYDQRVSISQNGETLMIGGDTSGDPPAHIYSKSGDSWVHQGALNSQLLYESSAVALSGDGTTALIGDYTAEPSGGAAFEGAVEIYERSGGNWNSTTTLTPDGDGDTDLYFGGSVSISGDGSTVLVCEPGAETSDGEDTGNVYTYEKSGGTWTRSTSITAEGTEPSGGLGASCELSDDATVALIGDTTYDEEGTSGSRGAGIVYEYVDGAWELYSKLTVEEGDWEAIGSSVGLAGDGSVATINTPGYADPAGKTLGYLYS